MDNSNSILQLEKRKKRSEDVAVKLVSSSIHGFIFNVYKENEKVKYFGEISQDHLHDECGCQSFYHGNSEDYQKTHPLPFQCKHIIKAHSQMEGLW